MFSDCDKRSKNASAFFGLGPQRNRNQRKRIHFHCSRRFDTSQPFGSRPVRMSCIRALPFTYRHLAPVGAGPNAPFRSIRVAGRFAPPQGRCKPECFLSIRRRALRRSVASSPDKTPPSPLNEGLLLSGKKQSAVSNKVEETTLFRHDLAATLQESGRKIRSSSKMQGSSCPRCFGKHVCRSAFCSRRMREKHLLFSTIRRPPMTTGSRFFPTGKGSITQAQSVRKIRITSCGFYGRLLCPLKNRSLLHFSYEQAGITLTA